MWQQYGDLECQGAEGGFLSDLLVRKRTLAPCTEAPEMLEREALAAEVSGIQTRGPVFFPQNLCETGKKAW